MNAAARHAANVRSSASSDRARRFLIMANLELAGKHKGIVVDNADPLKLGRLKVRVPEAYGEQSSEVLPWAWPCFAYGGMPQMALYAVPEVGAGVWVEFQWKDGQPDASHPVWRIYGHGHMAVRLDWPVARSGRNAVTSRGQR